MKSNAILLTMLLFVIQTPASGQNAVTTITDSRGDAVPASDGEPGSTLTEEQILITFGGMQEPQVPWKVSPAAEPKPAFRYEFWPRESELKPGSGLLYYFRAVTRVLQREGCLKTIRDIANRNVQTTAEDRAFIASMESVFEDLQTLAYCEDLSWDHRNRDIQGPRLYYFGLDDVQASRDLARLLMIKARIQLADGDFDGVSKTVLMGNRLAYLVGQGESVIQRLVACAITAMMRAIIEETIQTPGCPNLYWAIATIPLPIVSIRQSVELELDAIHRAFPALRQAQTADWSEETAMEQWVQCLKELRALLGSAESQDSRQTILAVDYSDFVEPARARLRAAGFTEECLEKMPEPSIVMADAAYELDRLADGIRKDILLPGPQNNPLTLISLHTAELQETRRLSEELGKDVSWNSAADLFAVPLFPSIQQLAAAADRTPIMLRRLMTLEAIRMYAAAHDGQLPNSLPELSPVPAVNAFPTEQPFEFSVESSDDGQVATLSGNIPNFPAANHLRFRIVTE